MLKGKIQLFNITNSQRENVPIKSKNREKEIMANIHDTSAQRLSKEKS